ncbi:ATP-binding protein [Pseudoalteromonas aurantia]|uniref:histidine kinase n=1 Tax=Pseudoalteromonas aurantia 208 TaxID=1314867 RepID=A0ABR9E6P9_9GAMM|nr:ATP-binding protein [Pseudoalteromonas aurantia]MBE0366675.1 hypothetical protein [Pseudoalteromonas aurantia 208]
MLNTQLHAPRKARSLKLGYWFILCTVLCFGWYVDTVNYNRLIEVERSRAYEEVNVYRTQIEGVLAANIQLVRGLAIALTNEAQLDQKRFEYIAQPLFRSSNVLRNLGAAPDMILSMTYPLKGNEKALGLNYLTHPTQSKDAIRARDSKKIVLAGPLTLIQGGEALIARVPVYNPDDTFWGLLSIVIDMKKLFKAVNLDMLDANYRIAIRGKNGLGEQGAFFHGNEDILHLQPLTFNIAIASGKWQLYAVPRFGWEPEVSAIWPFRLALLTIILLFISAFIFFNKLIKQLHDNAQTLTSMGNLAEVGAWSVDLKTRNITWSEVTKRIFEVPDHYQATWMSSTEFFKEGLHRRNFQRAIEQTIKHGTSFEEELIIVTAQGHERWILMKGKANQNNQWTVEIFGSVQNIQTRKNMEIEHDKIARNNELLAQLSSHDAVLNNHVDNAQSLAVDAICQGLNASRASIWVFNEEKTLLIPSCFSNTRQDSLQHFPPWRKNHLPELFHNVQRNQLIRANFAHSHECTLGLSEHYLGPFEVNALFGCTITYKDNVIGLLCAEYTLPNPDWGHSDERFIRAISAMLGSLFASQEQQKAKQQALMAKEIAEQSAKIKADFLASMSHEIRTPMNGILGMLDIVLNSNIDQSQRHHLNLAQNSAGSLLTIINDILDFSKIEAGKLDIEVIECDLIQILSDSISNFAPKAIEQHTELFIDSRNMQVQHAKTDPHRLKQVLNNLLSNAIKFTEHGKVTLTCYTEQQPASMRLWCSIEDSGVGISKTQLDKIFDSFTQADPSTTRRFGGTGLGLTIARQLCQLLGGALNAYSKLGVGSTFTFYIDLHEAKEIAPLNTPCDGLCIIDPHQQHELAAHHLLDAWRIPSEHFESLPAAMALLQEKRLTSPAIIIAESIVNDASDYQLSLLKKVTQQPDCCFAVISNKLSSNERFSHLDPDLVFLQPLTPANALKLCTLSTTKEAIPPAKLGAIDARILLVEDNKVNQVVALALLKRLNAKITCVDNGRLAIEHLKHASRYDVILMDCQMPELDGYQTTGQIRQAVAGQSHQSTPIIALTANAMQGDKEKCLAAGMDDYLSKPIEFTDLEKALRKWTQEVSQTTADSVK